MQAEYFVHDQLKISRDSSLLNIGTLDRILITHLNEHFPPCESVDWHYPDRDTFSVDQGVDLSTYANTDSVLFDFDHVDEAFEAYISSYFTWLEQASIPYSISYCRALYAHLHDDKETIEARGQIMFIIDNPSELILYCRDIYGKMTSVTPRAGDVVFLDISQPHALIPPAGAKAEPLKMVLIAFSCL